MELAGQVDQPKVARHEADHVPAALVLDQADRLAGQRLADEHRRAAPVDPTVRPEAAYLVVGVGCSNRY